MIGPPVRDPREQDRKKKALLALIAAKARQAGRHKAFGQVGRGARSSAAPMINRAFRPVGVLNFLQPRNQGDRRLSHSALLQGSVPGASLHAPRPLPEALPGSPPSPITIDGSAYVPLPQGGYAPASEVNQEAPPLFGDGLPFTPAQEAMIPTAQKISAANIASVLAGLFGHGQEPLGGGYSVDPETGRVAGAGRFVG